MVRWEFLLASLQNFGFGPCFTKWVQTLYKTPKSCVMTNGRISLGRHDRGTLEPLATTIKANTNILDKQQGGKEQKLILYAGDIMGLTVL